MSNASHDDQGELDGDLDAVEAELAKVELLLERLNEPNNPQGGR